MDEETKRRILTPGTPEAVEFRAKMTNNVLPILVARAGGFVEITQEEFNEVTARYGGASQMSLRFSAVGDGTTVRVEVFRKPPAQGELPV